MVALNNNDAILGDFKRLPCKTLVTRTNTAATIMFLRCIPMDLALFSEKKTKKIHPAPLILRCSRFASNASHLALAGGAKVANSGLGGSQV